MQAPYTATVGPTNCPAPAASDRGVGLISGWWQGFRQKRRIRRTERALEALCDHTLKDIGLDRSQVGSAARAVCSERRGQSEKFRMLMRLG